MNKLALDDENEKEIINEYFDQETNSEKNYSISISPVLETFSAWEAGLKILF